MDMLKSKYSPPHKFRVSEFHYSAGEIIEGSMRTGNCFVMAGTCSYEFSNKYRVGLTSGEYIQLSEGTYQLIVGDQDDLHIIVVWELPELANSE